MLENFLVNRKLLTNAAMLQEPSLVAFHDPGNGSGLFFLVWGPHGARAPEPARVP